MQQLSSQIPNANWIDSPEISERVVALFQALVVLVEAHIPQNLLHGEKGIQGGLIWVVRQQVVVGPGSGLVGFLYRCLRDG